MCNGLPANSKLKKKQLVEVLESKFILVNGKLELKSVHVNVVNNTEPVKVIKKHITSTISPEPVVQAVVHQLIYLHQLN